MVAEIFPGLLYVLGQGSIKEGLERRGSGNGMSFRHEIMRVPVRLE